MFSRANDYFEGKDNDRAQTLVEYVLVLGLVSVAAIVTVGLLGTLIDARLFEGVVSALLDLAP